MSVLVGLLAKGYFNKIVAQFFNIKKSLISLGLNQQQLDSLSWFPGWLYAVFTQPDIQIQIAVKLVSFSSSGTGKTPLFQF